MTRDICSAAIRRDGNVRYPYFPPGFLKPPAPEHLGWEMIPNASETRHNHSLSPRSSSSVLLWATRHSVVSAGV